MSGWKNMVDIPNFKDSEHSFISKIGSFGYKKIGDGDISQADGLLLFCEVNNKFLDKLNENQTLEVLDRLMKVGSNMVSPAFYFI